MARCEWDALPEGVRSAVEQQCGTVVKVEAPELGFSSDFSATLHLDEGRVFCKGVRADCPAAWMHRNEAAVNTLLPDGLAPRLLWQFEEAGWLLLGFEHAAGRYPDLAPYSEDLTPVADAVAMLGQLSSGEALTRSLAARFARLPVWRRYSQDPPADLDPWEAANLPRLLELEAAAPELIDGESLLHTDLQPGNLLIEDRRVTFIDWAWASRGAAWVDPAFLVIRLMSKGHTPETAESWACRIPAWRAAPAAAVTTFAATVLGLWEHRTRTAPRPHSRQLTATARRWARHRLEAHA